MARILFVDDEAERLQTISACLSDVGHTISIAESLQSGQQAMLSKPFDVLFVTDNLLKDQTSDLIATAKLADSSLAAIVFSASLSTASQLGAFDLLPLDCQMPRIITAARNAFTRALLFRENLALRTATEYLPGSQERNCQGV